MIIINDKSTSNLSQTKKISNDFFYDSTIPSPKKENGWFLSDKILNNKDFSLTQAVLFSIIQKLSSNAQGFAYPSNAFLTQKLKVKESCIRKNLRYLIKNKFIFIHTYNTRQGLKREFVTIKSAKNYCSYLKFHKRYDQLKKFKEDFFQKDFQEPSRSVKKPSIKSVPSPRTHLSQSIDGHPSKSTDAYNTTYSNNNINDVTCKKSDDSIDVSFSNLKKELEGLFSNDKVNMGLTWYEMQPADKKEKMKKPIACIVTALKKGYAEEYVASRNSKLKRELEKKKKVHSEERKKRLESENNKKIAAEVSEKYSSIEGYRDRFDSGCFVLHNDSLEKVKIKNPMGELKGYKLPDGSKKAGFPMLRVNFSLPTPKFKEALNQFFEESQWKTENSLE